MHRATGSGGMGPQARCMGLQAGCMGPQALDAWGYRLDALGCRLDAWGYKLGDNSHRQTRTVARPEAAGGASSKLSLEGREHSNACRLAAACMSVSAHCTLRGGVVSDGSCTR